MFNAELLEKYHKGELQLEEMQQLEKAMLQNPFLAETVEGIAFSKNSFSKPIKGKENLLPLFGSLSTVIMPFGCPSDSKETRF